MMNVMNGSWSNYLITILELIIICQYSGQTEITAQMNTLYYSKIEVANSRLTNENLLTSSCLESKIQCASQCSVTANCFLFCWNEDFDCMTYRIFATKTFMETETGPKSKCYTTLNDLVTGKTVEASPPPVAYTPQKQIDNDKSNLVNGIYDYIHCYTSAKLLKPYFVIDLGAVYTFKMITFICQNGSWAQYYCRGLYLKVSNTSAPTPGDFTNFADYGYFAGPGTPDQTVTIWKNAAARYIALQMDLGFSEHLKICYIEVI